MEKSGINCRKFPMKNQNFSTIPSPIRSSNSVHHLERNEINGKRMNSSYHSRIFGADPKRKTRKKEKIDG